MGSKAYYANRQLVKQQPHIKKQQVADIPHVGTPSGYLWFRIVDTHHGRGKSIGSIWKENTAENIWTSERKLIMEVRRNGELEGVIKGGEHCQVH